MRATGTFRGKPYDIALAPLIGQTDKYLSEPAAFAFTQLYQAAKAAGYVLKVNTAWRSYAYQQQLYNAYMAKKALGVPAAPAAEPGRSFHEIGEAVDISVQMGDRGELAPTPVYRWLQANAGRFGFKESVKGEPWHWQYMEDSITGKLNALVNSDEGDSGSDGFPWFRLLAMGGIVYYIFKKMR